MKKHFENQLPEGYEEAYTIDVKNKKVAVVLNIIAAVIMIAIIVLAIWMIKPTGFFDNFNMLRYFVFVFALVAYIILHELLHGLAYKVMTKQKLTFGISLSCAYCGVPNVYVYRKCALIALLTPFIVFSIVILVIVALMSDSWNQLYAMIIFAIHFGGCCGDLYDTFLYLFRFKDNSILMKDTGPKQTFYVKK